MRFPPITESLKVSLEHLRPLVDEYLTLERLRRYVETLSNEPAPSTSASALRAPLLRRLLQEDGAMNKEIKFFENFENTGNTVLLTGSKARKPLWYFTHLDTLCYLVQPEQEGRYPLVPFGYHLIEDGVRAARVYRFDLKQRRYKVVTEGELVSEGSEPFFHNQSAAVPLVPGDRISLVTPYREDAETGTFTGHIDNAGAVAALAAAAPLLAQFQVEAMLAFPDEEEGPRGSGNQMMGRGGSRIVNLLPTPELAIVADVQQAGGEVVPNIPGQVRNNVRLGEGAVLTEFSSLTRGAVTPPHLYALARELAQALAESGVKIQTSNNAYTSRSDDVSVFLKTPNVLLLGFPGFNRHFDRGEPRANLYDLMNLSKAFVYFSTLRPLLQDVQARLFES